MEVINTEELTIPMADRATRFLGALIDGFTTLIGMLILEVIFGEISQWLNPDKSLMVSLRMMSFGMISFLLIHGYFIAKRGQSLGKMVLDMRIVNADGEIPDWVKTVGVRHILVMFISNIPLLGILFSLVDAAFIFRNDKRCIHDLMAGTYVIQTMNEVAWKSGLNSVAPQS